MSDDKHEFEFDYRPGTIRCRPGCANDLGAELDRQEFERALVVCGSTVGSTPGVMDPVRDGLGDRLVGIFDETTPEKYLRTAVEGAERVQEEDADILVAVGGGSSLAVHGIVAPHVLRYLFDNVDGRRHLLAEAFDVRTDDRTDDEVAAAVVEAVADVRDALGLPDRLRDIDGLSESDLDDVAEIIAADSLMDTVPSDLDPTVDDVEEVLRNAW